MSSKTETAAILLEIALGSGNGSRFGKELTSVLAVYENLRPFRSIGRRFAVFMLSSFCRLPMNTPGEPAPLVVLEVHTDSIHVPHGRLPWSETGHPRQRRTGLDSPAG
jgi:hypothetical protein